MINTSYATFLIEFESRWNEQEIFNTTYESLKKLTAILSVNEFNVNNKYNIYIFDKNKRSFKKMDKNNFKKFIKELLDNTKNDNIILKKLLDIK